MLNKDDKAKLYIMFKYLYEMSNRNILTDQINWKMHELNMDKKLGDEAYRIKFTLEKVRMMPKENIVSESEVFAYFQPDFAHNGTITGMVIHEGDGMQSVPAGTKWE